MSSFVPPGYITLARPGAKIIAREQFADALLLASSRGSIYDWAAAEPGRRVMQGRLPVYAVQLPFGGPNVVVRRNHHGGMLASLRRDRFFVTRLPYELITSLVLANAGIPTAEVIAQASYRVNALERRVEVITRELPPGLDLGAALLDPARTAPDTRAAQWTAVQTLLAMLAAKGVWHQDLNVKNVYLVDESPATVRAVLLDVDRVQFHVPGALVARANAARLVRSLVKWHALHGAVLGEAELRLVRMAATGA